MIIIYTIFLKLIICNRDVFYFANYPLIEIYIQNIKREFPFFNQKACYERDAENITKFLSCR